MTLDCLEALVEGLGEPAYRARQIFGWIYGRLAVDPLDMTDLPLALRQRLAAETAVRSVSALDRLEAPDGTVKFLMGLSDGRVVETVLMDQNYGETVCLSVQVGCRWRCAFCASGAAGFERGLGVDELSGQVLEVASYLQRRGKRVQNLVLMGMGEPLDEPETTIRFVRIMGDRAGMGLSPRRFTVSTVGIVPGIDRLAQEDLPVTLAVSLHAPNDHIRDQLVPANRQYPSGAVVEACRRYFRATGRRVTFEYVMIEGVNDLPELARELAILLGNMPAHVNLIPLNPVDHSRYRASPAARVEQFGALLGRLGPYSVTVRRAQGLGICGGCGQLRLLRSPGALGGSEHDS